MKKHILLFLLIALTSCKSYSQILPLSTNSLDAPNGWYIKDIDNEFQPYIGTWEYSWDGKKVTFNIEKVEMNEHTFPNGDYFYEDFLVVKYTVINVATNQILDSNTGFVNPKDSKIRSVAVDSQKLFLTYFDHQRCDLHAEIVLKIIPSNLNTLKYIFLIDYFDNYNCNYLEPNGDLLPLIPNNVVILTKV